VQFLVLKDQQQYGPYDVADLQSYVRQGSFALTDLCWQEGWPEWRPVAAVVTVPPPPPSRSAPPPPVGVAAEGVSANSVSSRKEETLWEGHTTWWKYARGIFWTVILALIAAIFTLGLSLLVIPFFLALFYFERKRRRYFVTSKRVKAEWGLVVKSSAEVRIKDIRATNVVRRGLSGLFGIGTLEFCSAGGGGVEVTFQAIHNAQSVKDIVTGLQD
jgi:hypothetical protein